MIRLVKLSINRSNLKNFFLAFLLVFNIINLSSVAYAETSNELNKIKELIQRVTQAFNAKDSEKLASYFTDTFTLITLENQKITPLPSFLVYWDTLFKGDKASVKKFTLEMQIDPDPIYMDNKIAILQGSAKEEFVYYKGDDQTLHTRWTAVLEKNPSKSSEWKVSAIHHSSGITKTMLNKIQSELFKTTLGGLIVGLVLGILIISLSRKTKNR